jgi:phage terminase large subunit
VPTIALDLKVPRWAVPLLKPARYKGAKGGRSSGKSHFMAERVVKRAVSDPNLRFVCIREVQRSLQFSAKALIESKIRSLGVAHLFLVQERLIRRRGGRGLIIFEGLQDHTADSIKSLEDFGGAWVEEAQSLSKRSLELLLPTIRVEGSEIWFSWNPETPDAPVETLFRELAGDAYPLRSGSAVGDGYAVVHVNYLENPFVPQVSRDDAARVIRIDPDDYEHIWLGGYNSKSEAQVLRGKWVVDEFEPAKDWDGPYHGADFGFAEDPTALVRCWVHANRLYIEQEAWKIELETNHMVQHWTNAVPDLEGYTIRADSARPETISYLRQHGLPKVIGVDKWPGSVRDGIAHLRHYEKIVVHPRCEHTQEEFKLYSYKVDRLTGDVLPEIMDRHNNVPDAIRYALAPLIQARRKRGWGAIPATRYGT